MLVKIYQQQKKGDKMRILVIGGAGYIGSHVVKSLLQNNVQVRVFDDMSTGQSVNLFKDAEFIKGTILDSEALENALEGVDGVVHLAAKKAVGESMENPEKYAQNNLTGAINLLNAMTKKDVKYLVFSSSAAVYGIPQYAQVDENHPVNPINFYGFTKLEMERLMQWYDTLKGIKFVSLRYFNAVGYDADGDILGLEKNPQNLLPVIMETLIGTREKMAVFGTDYNTPDGSCIRDYIHVSDLAEAHTLALKYLQENNQSQILNLGTGRGHSVLEMILETEKLLNKKVNYTIAPRRSGDPETLTAVATKAENLLNWYPKQSDLENIILTTWAVYQKNR